MLGLINESNETDRTGHEPQPESGAKWSSFAIRSESLGISLKKKKTEKYQKETNLILIGSRNSQRNSSLSLSRLV